jgi:D-threo-aldose 1-dehydrogenase
MDEIVLPNGRRTTRLGFGCSGLIGGSAANWSRHLLDVALDAGFRHFDVAPSYGHGLAENILGEVLKSAGKEVTIATKVGIGRPRNPTLILAARDRLLPILSRAQWLRRAVSGATSSISRPIGLFGEDYIRDMLNDSLSRLQTNVIDIYLLHEITQTEMNDALVEFMISLRYNGTVGAFGTGTSRQETSLIEEKYPQIAAVQQYSWSILDPAIPLVHDRLTIIHGSIQLGLETVGNFLATRAHLVKRWSGLLGVDLTDRGCLADILLASAIAENPNGIVLVSSQQPDRVRRFAAVSKDTALRQAGAEFRRFLLECGSAMIGAGCRASSWARNWRED